MTPSIQKPTPPAVPQPAREAAARPLLDRLRQRLEAPVDMAGLAYFRIAFGAVMLWEVGRFLDLRWIENYFSGKEYYFTYWPFTFVEPLPETWLRGLIVGMGVLALMVIVGLFYRTAATLFFLAITYLFLLEKARYLNHMYLVCLIAFLMIFVPLHRCFSLDAARRPRLAADTVPAFWLWLLRFQIGVPYFFGGIAKINHDWLHGEPLRAWLADRTDFPFLGPYFEEPPVVWVMTYGSLLLDLLAPLLLLSRRTRVFAFWLLLLFHLMNSRLFGIGIFPWAMIATTVVFFPPDWPRRLWRDVVERHPFRFPALVAGAVLGFFVGGLLPRGFVLARALIGALGVGLAAYHLDRPLGRRREAPATAPAAPGGAIGHPRWVYGLLGLWVAVQVLLPLRHLVIPGIVHWTEEGHNFSWHMKLRDKDATTLFHLSDPTTGVRWTVNPRDHLSSRQVSKMSSRPHMIVPFARYLEKIHLAQGFEDVEVRVESRASLNGRRPQPLVDPTVDLTRVPYPWIGHAEWILPLTEPLPEPGTDGAYSMGPGEDE